MYYICIENNQTISVLNYRPEVPSHIEVIEISDVEHALIKDETHYFDVPSRTVKAVGAEVTQRKAQELENMKLKEFLASTDWKVLRHIREKALNLPTSLSENQYLELEQQRADAASKIV